MPLPGLGAPPGLAAVAVPNAELTPEERRVLGGFLQRRWELLPQAREALAERLARRFGASIGAGAVTALKSAAILR